jgi:hypothetical protein
MVSRGIWDHPEFAPSTFSEREAFLWLVSEAAWKPRRKRVGKVVVDLDRGQLAHSTRFLSDAWDWSHSKVRRFLERLENRHMIERHTDTGVSVIYITNYEAYQWSQKPSGTVTARKAAQQRHSSGTNENKGNKGNKEKEVEPKGSLSLCDPIHANDLSEAVTIYNTAAEHAGWPKVQKMTPARSRSLKARMKDCGGLEGWRDALRRAYASDFCREDWRGFSFDSLISQQKFTSLMEGKYDNRSRNTGQPANRSENRPDPALEQIARLAGISQASGDGRG